MSRLLFPEAFGEIAVAISLLLGLVLISDLGIQTIILQSPRGDQDRFLRTAWTLQICRGLGLWVMLALLCGSMSFPAVRKAFPAEGVFASPQFPLVTAVLGIGLLVLGGMESTAVHLNVRRLNLRPIVLLDLAGRIFPLPVMVLWAWLVPSVWALVAGAVSGSIVRLAISHVGVPGPTMSLAWDRAHVREIVRFGKWITLSSTATFIAGQSDRLILGFMLPLSVLGLYSIAKMLIDTVEAVLERLNSSLTIPVLGEVIRNNYRELKEKYYRFRLPFELFAPLLGGILLSTGSLVVHILFDDRYADAGHMLQILGVGLSTYPALFIGGVFTVNGEPHVVAMVSILRAISLITCLILGYVIAGISGAIWGIAIHKFVPSAAILLLARQRQWVDARKELRIIPIFMIGVIIGEGILMIAGAVGVTQVGHFWH
jgi:O-antigen/teichoic acid export membrane protein